MKNSKFLKLFSFLYILILLLPGCNKLDNKNILPTITPTEELYLQPLAKSTVVTSTPTPSLGSLKNTEDNMMIEEPTNEVANNELCSMDEDVLLSFNIANSDKTVSICISKQKSNYIIYRYGKPNDIELEYPEKTESSWDKFTYSYYVRGGGTDNEGIDLNYLNFENGKFNYKIFEEYDSETDKSMVGITVTNLKTGEETDIQGDSNSIKGTLIDLRDNDKINIIVQ